MDKHAYWKIVQQLEAAIAAGTVDGGTPRKTVMKRDAVKQGVVRHPQKGSGEKMGFRTNGGGRIPRKTNGQLKNITIEANFY